VQCCHGSDVDTVIVNGELLMHQKRILVLDEDALLRECEQAVTGLRQRAGLN
jgi:5-methylthioadenosine/S-adenosylhomocysteine deaminase